MSGYNPVFFYIQFIVSLFVAVWIVDTIGFIYPVILITIVLVLLVALNVIKPRWYVYVIYFIGLGALYSTTLLGLSVVGSDMARELLMSKLALQNGWDLTLVDPSNTSVVVGFIVPSLSLLFNTQPEWVYKVILPLIFSFTPVILYLIFNKQIGESKAFYASVFFIIMPVFSLEIASIGKSMVAETLMALCLWVMFSEWKSWKKCVFMTILTILTMWAHYTVGVLLVAFLACGFGVRIVVSLFLKRWALWDKKSIALWVIPIVLVCSIVPFSFYYSNVSHGESRGLIVDTIIRTADSGIFKKHTTEELKAAEEHGTLRFMNREPLLQLAVAKDFLGASISGKIFRIIQYLTQVLIIIGSVWLLFKHRLYKFRTEFIACIGGSFAMLALCIFLPSFAAILNITRWYHMSLFFLAPMFVIGFDWVGYKRC